MKTTVVGSYPKIVENQLLRKTLWEIDRQGGQPDGKLEEVIRTVTKTAIREQEEAGLDSISDGGIRWEDEVTAPLRGMEGIELTGLIRYFDTNTLFRQPVITGPIKLKSPALAPDYAFAAGQTKKQVKAILTGPFTISRCSRDEHYRSQEKVTLALAEALAGEVRALEKAGAGEIQVNEPYLLSEPASFASFEQAFKILTQGVRAAVTLYFSFGDFSGIFPRILDVAPSRIGFDLTTTPRARAILGDGALKGKKLLLGAVDARNTRLETADELFNALRSATRNVAPEDLEVAPSASLEFLPLDRCRAKLKNMVNLVARFKEEK